MCGVSWIGWWMVDSGAQTKKSSSLHFKLEQVTVCVNNANELAKEVLFVLQLHNGFRIKVEFLVKMFMHDMETINVTRNSANVKCHFWGSCMGPW